jgi:hypothetical protein
MQHVRARDGREGAQATVSVGQSRQSTGQNRAQPERELVQVEAGGSTLDIGERGKGRVAGADWLDWLDSGKQGPRGRPKACQGRVNRYLPQPMPVH